MRGREGGGRFDGAHPGCAPARRRAHRSGQTAGPRAGVGWCHDAPRSASAGELLPFKPQVFQSWLMFFGMLFALPMYLGTEWLRARKARHDPALKACQGPEPSAARASPSPNLSRNLRVGGDGRRAAGDGQDAADARPPRCLRPPVGAGLRASDTNGRHPPPVDGRLLFSGSRFACRQVLLMVAGLMHISASIWMLLRGGGIVFVALMKQFALGDRLTCGSPTLPGHFRDTLPGHFLGDRLTPAMWWGVGFIALAVTMVGLSPMLAEAPRRLHLAPPPRTSARTSTRT